ncbi:hypothetical protein OLMES_1562 [Oleiphilus messinensis]|uniref:Uncharacterized protein n=1 Tax=Oleiphilus messinensis TaxID=141451 RepID=A0A1Y0I583_9GAMM|nr:hypothetical protein OLMES_1562 [Oleiphilus messinensis]
MKFSKGCMTDIDNQTRETFLQVHDLFMNILFIFYCRYPDPDIGRKRDVIWCCQQDSGYVRLLYDLWTRSLV